MTRTVVAWCVAAVAILLTAAVLFTFAFRQDDVCGQVEDLRTAVRAVLANARASAITSPDLSPAQRVGAVRFYDGALALVPKHTC